jgi:hypothetical protein
MKKSFEYLVCLIALAVIVIGATISEFEDGSTTKIISFDGISNQTVQFNITTTDYNVTEAKITLSGTLTKIYRETYNVSNFDNSSSMSAGNEEMVLVNDILYVTSKGKDEILIINSSEPTTPYQIGTYSNDLDYVLYMETDGQYLFSTNNPSGLCDYIAVHNITSDGVIQNLTKILAKSDDCDIYALTVNNDLLIFADFDDNTTHSYPNVTTYNISTYPFTFVSSFQYTEDKVNFYQNDMLLSDDNLLYILYTDGSGAGNDPHMRVYNYSDPSSPVYIAKHDFGNVNKDRLLIDGDYLYATDGGGFEIYNRTLLNIDEGDPTKLSDTDTLGDCEEMLKLEDTLYVTCDGNSAIHAFNVSDATAPYNVWNYSSVPWTSSVKYIVNGSDYLIANPTGATRLTFFQYNTTSITNLSIFTNNILDYQDNSLWDGSEVSSEEISLNSTNINNQEGNLRNITLFSSTKGSLIFNSINITVEDIVAPRYSSAGDNFSAPSYNDALLFYMQWDDGVNISTIVFSINDSRVFVNTSYSASSNSVNQSAYINLTNTRNLTSFCWMWYANDTANNWNQTGYYCDNITKTLPEATVLIQNKPLGTGQDLVAALSCTDSENDTLEPDANETRWYVGDVYNSTYDNLTLINSENTSNGDKWTVSYRCKDLYNYSDWDNDTVVINDSIAPTINSISVSANSVYTTGSVTFTANVTDVSSPINDDACIYGMYKSDLATTDFNITSNAISGDLVSKALSMSQYGVGTMEFRQIWCDDASANRASNLSVNINITISAAPSGGGGDSGGGGGGGASTPSGDCSLQLYRPAAGALITLYSAKEGEYSFESPIYIKNIGDGEGTYNFRIIDNDFLATNCRFNSTSLSVKPNLEGRNTISCQIHPETQQAKIEIQGCGDTNYYNLQVAKSAVGAFFACLYTGSDKCAFGGIFVSSGFILTVMILFVIFILVAFYIIYRLIKK